MEPFEELIQKVGRVKAENIIYQHFKKAFNAA